MKLGPFIASRYSSGNVMWTNMSVDPVVLIDNTLAIAGVIIYHAIAIAGVIIYYAVAIAGAIIYYPL
jgi:hypothetical protein